ncbi:MAG: hypothetical protein ABI895_13475 [Deltaproteobacteria bacterium]
MEAPKSAADFGHATAAGWWSFSLLGALACNALLGIEEASLRCDPDPCATEGASVVGRPASDEKSGAEVLTADAEMGSASSAAAGDGVPAVSAPARDSASGAGERPRDESGGSLAASSGDGPRAGDAGAPSSPAADGGSQTAPACNGGNDACGACLCDACRDELVTCGALPGCAEILACARANDCFGIDCYCGSANLITCATSGRGNGLCVDATLAAAGSHPPTLVNPSAGPASDAALAVANCTANACGAACGT